MKKLKLSQAEIDKLVVADRRGVLPTVYGVARNDVCFQVSINLKLCWQYKIWCSMLQRCFDQKEKGRHPRYNHTNCCAEWLSFGNFLEWVNKETEYTGRQIGFELDKDILFKGNQVYSKDNCCFVPKEINMLIRDVFTGRYKEKLRGKYRVQNMGKHVGYFDTPEEAFLAYKVAKEAQIKAVANQHKDVLKPAVYESLMNWEIEP